MTDAPETTSNGREPALHFDAVLRPHRSLGPHGFAILMIAIAGISFAAGLFFFLIGAWPIFGFFGLDVLLIYLAFRFSYRDARAFEAIRLQDDALIVRRVDRHGRFEECRFQPNWLRLDLEEPETGPGMLVLTSHGRSVSVGRFLTRDERQELTAALRGALDRLRAPAV
ncbi:DUF2244 domain-containing protein [Oceanibacterium hippocampi]|nr:DUF2244 domain-containing protein [Oceanibacterium hippocampi]